MGIGAYGSVGSYGSYSAYGKKSSAYTIGSLYKRNQLTIGQSMLRRTIENYNAQVRSAGPSLFGQLASASEQTSILTLKQVEARLLAELQTKRSSFSIRI